MSEPPVGSVDGECAPQQAESWPRQFRLETWHITLLLVIQACAPTLKDLARMAGLSKSAMAHQVNRLVQAGFLEKQPARSRGRALTPAGLELVSGFCLAQRDEGGWLRRAGYRDVAAGRIRRGYRTLIGGAPPKELADDKRDAIAWDQLTRGQLEVMHGLMCGELYQQTAGRLGISRDTVRSRAGRVMATLQARTKTQAMVLLIRAGELPLEHSIPWPHPAPPEGLEKVTGHQMEIIKALAAGAMLDEIAARLGITRRSVHRRIEAVCMHARAATWAEAVAVLVLAGWL